MKHVKPNQGRLLPHVEGEPNFYEIKKYFWLPPAVGYPQGGQHHQYYHPQIDQDRSEGYGGYAQDQQYPYQGGGTRLRIMVILTTPTWLMQ
jgi:hypothetical protein